MWIFGKTSVGQNFLAPLLLDKSLITYNQPILNPYIIQPLIELGYIWIIYGLYMEYIWIIVYYVK